MHCDFPSGIDWQLKTTESYFNIVNTHQINGDICLGYFSYKYKKIKNLPFYWVIISAAILFTSFYL